MTRVRPGSGPRERQLARRGHASEPAGHLPEGTFVRPLEGHPDDRGSFTEIFRACWPTGVRPVQWNLVRSRPGVLRGVHVHVKHADYLVVLEGQASIGLRDLRDESVTSGRAAVVELDGDAPAAITIPPGVAHGFYFHSRAIHIYAVTEYWDPEDELGCHWSDPDLGIPWEVSPRALSPRDASAPPLSVLLRDLRARRADRAPGAGTTGARSIGSAGRGPIARPVDTSRPGGRIPARRTPPPRP